MTGKEIRMVDEQSHHLVLCLHLKSSYLSTTTLHVAYSTLSLVNVLIQEIISILHQNVATNWSSFIKLQKKMATCICLFSKYMTLCSVLCHLYNLKNMKNTYVTFSKVVGFSSYVLASNLLIASLMYPICGDGVLADHFCYVSLWRNFNRQLLSFVRQWLSKNKSV